MEAFVTKILKRVAKKAKIKIISEPEWGFAGQIITKNGEKKYFKNTCFDLNTLGATEIARDKDYSNYFMKKMNYPVIEGKAFYSDKWCKQIGSKSDLDAAYNFALKIGFPVFIKPNSKSQGNCAQKIYDKAGFYRSMRRIFEIDNIALVQKFITGHDYRVVVLDGKVYSAYERIPLSVIGDGKTSIMNLLKRKQDDFKKSGRGKVIKIDDPRIKEKLEDLRLNVKASSGDSCDFGNSGFNSSVNSGFDSGFDFIPASGQKIFLLDNANLSSGGDAIDVTNEIHPYYKEISIKLAKDMGLRLCGVDIMVDCPTNLKAGKKDWHVIEVNSSPGVENYASLGKEQMKIVENLYADILNKMYN